MHKLFIFFLCSATLAAAQTSTVMVNADNEIVAPAAAAFRAANDIASNTDLTTVSNSVATVTADLVTHEADETNPHAVTAAQVGSYTTAQADALLNTKQDAATAATDAELASKINTSSLQSLITADEAVIPTSRAVIDFIRRDLSLNGLAYDTTLEDISKNANDATMVSGRHVILDGTAAEYFRTGTIPAGTYYAKFWAKRNSAGVDGTLTVTELGGSNTAAVTVTSDSWVLYQTPNITLAAGAALDFEASVSGIAMGYLEIFSSVDALVARYWLTDAVETNMTGRLMLDSYGGNHGTYTRAEGVGLSDCPATQLLSKNFNLRVWNKDDTVANSGSFNVTWTTKNLTGDWYVQFEYRGLSELAQRVLAATAGSDNNFVLDAANSRIGVTIGGASTVYLSSISGWNQTSLHTYKFVRTGSSIQIFIDGASKGTITVGTGALPINGVSDTAQFIANIDLNGTVIKGNSARKASWNGGTVQSVAPLVVIPEDEQNPGYDVFGHEIVKSRETDSELNFFGKGYAEIGKAIPSQKTLYIQAYWHGSDACYWLDDGAGVVVESNTSGAISTSGITAPTIYVNGVASSQLVAGWNLVTITTDTAFDIAAGAEIGRKSGTTYSAEPLQYILSYPSKHQAN